MGRYRKTVAALVAAGIAWAQLVTQSAPGPITAEEWIAGAMLLAGALGVYGATNDPAPPIPPVSAPK